MRTDHLNQEFGADRHPEETHLLLALERELPAAEAETVERHVGACWECRARYHEIQRGILLFVEYRDKVYVPELESPPHDFQQFSLLLKRTAADGHKASLLHRIRRFIRTCFSFAQESLQAKWVAATAAIVAAVLFWTQVLTPPTLSANELLTKAAQSQNPATAAHHKIRQKIRVKSDRTETVREFEWETGGPIPGAKWGTDPENWTAPLTAEGFSQWHDSLSRPKDKVKKSGVRWRLHTVAYGGPIKEAYLVVRANDFHPIEQHIRFSNGRSIDLTEISFELGEQTTVDSSSAQVRSVAPQVTAHTPAATAPSSINLDEAELELRYALFVHRLDNDEDLQISRAGNEVIVSGIASSAERLHEVQDAVSGLQGVRVALSAPASAVGSSGLPPSKRQADVSPVPLLKDRLDSAFESPAARRDFVDSCLSSSDTALSHAWALKRLAERYNADARRALKPESRAKLDEMMREHLQQIATANVELYGLLDLLPQPQTPRAEGGPVDAGGGVAALFDLVQRQDSLVAALVAGTQTTDTAATAANKFLAGHDTIARLADELKP